jgi:2-oxoglutarate ferredoxin oxidoreductase subunit alpha
MGKHNTPGPGPEAHWRRIAEKFEAVGAAEQRWEQGFCEDAEAVVCAFGTGGKFVEYVVGELRREGVKVGFFRPVTLWPFPEAALEAACRGARLALVFELNAGQMIDDVRLSLGKRIPIRGIGGISSDAAGINIGTWMDAGLIRSRILDALQKAPQ